MYRVSCYKVTIDKEDFLYSIDFNTKDEAEKFAQERSEEYEKDYTCEDYENGFENPYCLFIKEIKE